MGGLPQAELTKDFLPTPSGQAYIPGMLHVFATAIADIDRPLEDPTHDTAPMTLRP